MRPTRFCAFICLLLVFSCIPVLMPASGEKDDAVPTAGNEMVFIDGTPIWEEMVRLYGGDITSSRDASRYYAGGGDHCDVYVQSGFPTQKQIDDLISEFDDLIWPTDITAFGEIGVDKISIIIQEIDGPYGIGGYYQPGTWEIHIDAADLSIWGYQICAHEFQHLIHDKKDRGEELWLNEGMADLAIELCYGADASALTSHVNGFEDHPDNDLTVFDNTMYDYGSAYAFASYVHEHFGGGQTTRAIVASTDHGMGSVLGTLGDEGYDISEEHLFIDWSVANRADDKTIDDGQYGYEDLEIGLQDAQVHEVVPASGSEPIESWSSDSIEFTGGDGRDATIEVEALGHPFQAKVYEYISSNEARVQEIGVVAGKGEANIQGFGSDVISAFLIVTGQEELEFSFLIEYRDVTPPTTTMVVAPGFPDGDADWYVTQPSIQFFTNEDSWTYFRWDDEPEDRYYCPECDPSIVPIAPEGEHELHYYSVDNFDNVEDARSIVFKVDTYVPRTTMVTDPSEPDGRNGWYQTAPEVTLECDDCDTMFYGWGTGTDIRYENGTILFPEEGVSDLYYHATDKAGNVEATRKTTFRVDTIFPSTTYSVNPSSPDGPDGWYGTTPVITLWTEETETDIFYRWNGGTHILYTGPIKAKDGENVLEYWAEDKVGNKEDVNTANFKVDTVPAITRVMMTPQHPDGNDGWYISLPRIILSCDEKDADIYYRWDGGTEERYRSDLMAVEGEHRFTYYSIDAVGNEEDRQEMTIKVDTIDPKVSLGLSEERIAGSDWYHGPIYVDLTIDDEDEEGSTPSIMYSWNTEVFSQYSRSIEAIAGKHILTYYAEDEAGNEGPVKKMDLWVDTMEPVAQFTIDVFVPVGAEMRVDASVSFDDNEIVKYTYDFGDGTRMSSPDPEEFHTYRNPGTFTVVLTVEDESGRTGAYKRQIEVEDLGGDGVVTGITAPMLTTGFLVIVLAVLVGRMAINMRR